LKHLTTDQLLSYQLNNLSNKESLLLDSHLSECESCQNELELLAELNEEWLNPSNVDIPNDFLNEIMLQTEEIQISKQDNKQYVKSIDSKKVRFLHLLLAAAATFLFFQFQLTKHISNSNRHVVQTIEQTTILIEKSEKLSIPIPKILRGLKN